MSNTFKIIGVPESCDWPVAIDFINLFEGREENINFLVRDSDERLMILIFSRPWPNSRDKLSFSLDFNGVLYTYEARARSTIGAKNAMVQMKIEYRPGVKNPEERGTATVISPAFRKYLYPEV